MPSAPPFSTVPHPGHQGLSTPSALSTNGLPPSNALFPALYLYPLNDTWAPKHIALTNMHTKIGRQTSSKTAPGERNGFFDSKVLSRQHAEVWEDGGKIYIKDVKSSNGTFINGERLSSEGHESEPFELKSDDIVEFGIDIVGEDNKTIIHHKVAARVVCVFTEQDAQVAARAEQHQAMHQQQQAAQQHQHQQHQQGPSGFMGQGQQGLGGLGGQAHGGLGGPLGLGAMGGQPQGVLNGLGVNGAPSNGVGGPQQQQGQNFPFAQAAQQAGRRPQLAQGLGSMGGIGLRPPGKTGLSFDVILSRLQGEVQKSRETGAELGSLTGAMGEIGDVLGGVGVPANLPPFPTHLPPVRAPPPDAQPSIPLPPPPSAAAPSAAGQAGSPTASVNVPAAASAEGGAALSSTSSTDQPTASTSSPPSTSSQPSTLPSTLIAELQTQIRETQSSLAAHHDRVRQLEGALKEQEGLRREVGVLREIVMRHGGASASSSSAGWREAGVHEEEGRAEEEGEEHDAQDEEEEEEDDDDDARSVSTVMPHELESVEEEDEEAVARAERGEDTDVHVDGGDAEKHPDSDDQPCVVEGEVVSSVQEEEHHEKEPVGEHQAEESESDDDAEARKQEDLNVGRPRTPEPSLLGMGERRASPLVRRRPDAAPGDHAEEEDDEADEEDRFRPSEASSNDTSKDVLAQVTQLSLQVSSVVALTEALQRQHAEAQDVIRALERKVEGLEGLLERATNGGAAEEKVSVKTEPDVKIEDPVVEAKEPPASAPDDDSALAEKMALWKKAVEGQWSTVRDEWRDERARLEKAREEWEARVRLVEFGFERMKMREQEEAQVAHAEGKVLVNGSATGNGHGHGGLATPPSPRSQSSDSGRYRRRKKRAALAALGTVAGSSGASSSEGEEGSGAEDASKESKLAKGKIAPKLGDEPERSLATPEPSVVFKLSDSAVSSLDGDRDEREPSKARLHPLAHTADPGDDALLDPALSASLELDDDSLAGEHRDVDDDDDDDGREVGERALDKQHSELSSRDKDKDLGNGPNINVQAAVGVVLLSVAAAAVFWKIKPE